MARRYWLMKSEPSVFSIEDLRAKGTAPWDGVRNFIARNYMRAMKVGDGVLFYHSSEEPIGVAGLAEVAKEAHPDPTAWDQKSDYYDPRSRPDRPLWDQVEVRWVETFPRLVPLEDLRRARELRALIILRRGNRLSVTPVTEKQWNRIVQMGHLA